MAHQLSLLALILTAALAGAAGGPARPAIWRVYERAQRFDSDEMNQLVYRANVEAHWLGDNTRFWYRNDVRGEREFIRVDAERGLRMPAFDHSRLAAALSRAAGQAFTARRLPLEALSFSPDATTLQARVGSTWWKCDLTTYECIRDAAVVGRGFMPRPAGDDPPPYKTEGPPPAAPRQEGESPDGRWVAFVRDWNLYLRPTGGPAARLSTNGEERHRFTSLLWSPDSRHLVAFRTEPGDNAEMLTLESAPPGSLRPKLHSVVYPLPGDKVDTHEIFVFDPAARTETRADTEIIDWWGPPEIRWRRDNRHFTFQQTHRGFQRVRVVEVDAETGATRTVIDERSQTFVASMKVFAHYVDQGREIIWASERDGWNHLYLYDGDTGQVKNQITRGEWVVRGVEEVDESKRQILFRAGGTEPGQDPYLVHFYRANFDGTGLVRLTEGNGSHSLRFSPDRRYYLDSYSRTDLAPVTELRRTADGKLICKLEEADVKDLLRTGWRWPEPFCARGRDGKTDIWGVIYRPTNLAPTGRYPVIEDIYAGPQGSAVPKTFSPRRAQQALAELGFVVVQIDGMGMSDRSKAFHDVCWHNLGDSGFPDRILWMKAAAARYPYLDLTRVGIYGHSAGGYNAAHALIAHPEFYKVAVAESGNHDHRTDKAWWNEQWMGYPVGPHYREQSNIENAAKLRGKLLLVHGELDDNVNPHGSTLRFADALIKANRDFDLLILPGQNHGYSGNYPRRRLWDYFVRNLQGIEPPEGFEFQAPADTSCHVSIRNARPTPVAVFWVDFDGKLRKYHDLAPGQTVTQHTFYGHSWEAQVEGRTVSWFTAQPDALQWVIEAPPTP